MTTTVVLGAEYDGDLREALKSVLKAHGALVVDSAWGVGGSQELETLTVELDGHTLIVEAETYMGLKITGDDRLVAEIVEWLGLSR